MKKFKNDVQKYLIDSIEIEIGSIEDSLASYQTRLARTETIIQFNKQKSQLSLSEVHEKEKQRGQQILNDKMNIGKDKSMLKLIEKECQVQASQDDEPVQVCFSTDYKKLNWRKRLVNRLLVLACKKIIIFDLDKSDIKITYSIPLE